MFGDFHLLFGLKSNFCAKAGVRLLLQGDEEQCDTMNLKKGIFEDLAEMYPKTKAVLEEKAFEKRSVMMGYLLKHKKLAKFVLANKKEVKEDVFASN